MFFKYIPEWLQVFPQSDPIETQKFVSNYVLKYVLS